MAVGGTEAKSAMSNPNLASDAKGRRDHYVPQAYLRGFIHPQRQGHPKPLWVLDLRGHEWSEKSPSQIGWAHGFYDYAPGSNPDATADDASADWRTTFPESGIASVRTDISAGQSTEMRSYTSRS